jgi:hypothetical protein
MLSQNRTFYNSNLSKAGLTTMGFFPKTKTISQIKRDNQQTRQSTYNYIDSMYRTGNNFKYNLKKPHQGTHRSHLNSMEERVREMAKLNPNDLSKYNIIKEQCDIMRIQLKDDYNKLKYELNSEIDNLQMKFNLELGKQKIRNSKINSQMKELNKEMLESQNLVSELKERINSLKLRIDGNGMFNEDGLPFLNTKIE